MRSFHEQNESINMDYKTFCKQILTEELLPTEKRTLKNLPRYATGKSKLPFTEYLGLKRNGSKGYDGKYYGWSHRAVAGFGVGDEVSGDSMAHKDYKWEDSDNGTKHKPYKIKTDDEAKEHAIRFGKSVS